ncbi:MATE family multidrug resistance protein [Dysgonomonas sp. PH5-45]|uniref:MATE family efflux transporter n=1 Tax=unclassified Dysgonomonas TaxID=2630389 RepID=UPI002476765E|nr:MULTISPECIES: MATE family efflux transporter [unclassified Dysgonomonas]MDH6354478.1 MATE family multidrug resistance protein [Dysgonomonas sp. PH5-45]MDH6387465.1 MATE family multidrug resistance protein [Dysgonomonas sp. PH5-37]
MYSYKDIWRVSLPIMLGLLAQNIMQIVNTLFLRQIGSVEFTASNIAGIYYIAFFMLAFGFSVGAQIMISRRNGEGNHFRIGSIVIQGMLFLEVLAMVLFGLSSYFSAHMLPLIIKSPEVCAAAEHYLEWRMYGFFISFINVMFRSFYVGIARTSVLTINAVIMATVNIVLDYVLILGNFGFPSMGIAGAGIASLSAEVASVIFFLIYTYKTVDLRKYGFHRMRFDFRIVKNILNISVFTMVQYTLSLSTWFIFFVAIENHGLRDADIATTIRVFYMVFFIPMNALATTANTLVGNTMGLGKIDDVIPLIKKVCKLMLAVIVAMMAVTIIMPEYWISLIMTSSDMQLVRDAVPALLVVVFALPFCGLGSVVFNSISGTGNTRTALAFEIVTLFLYMFGVWLIVIEWKAPVAACWAVEYIYWGFLFLFSVLYLKFGKWQLKKV